MKNHPPSKAKTPARQFDPKKLHALLSDEDRRQDGSGETFWPEPEKEQPPRETSGPIRQNIVELTVSEEESPTIRYTREEKPTPNE